MFSSVVPPAAGHERRGPIPPPPEPGEDRYLVYAALLHDSTAARVGALFQLLVQDTTAQDFGLPSSAIRLRM